MPGCKRPRKSFFCIRNTRWTPGRAGGRTPGDDIFSGCSRSLDVCARLARSMAAAASRARNRCRRQYRHVVGGRRTAEGTGRIWRLARRRVAGLHAGNAGLWHWRRHHRPFGRPVRHRGGDRHGNPLAAVRLSCRRCIDRTMAVHAGAFFHWTGLVRDICTIDGGSIALVRAPARHRRHDRRQRQLCRRRDLADVHRARHGAIWLAGDAYRHRHLLRSRDDAPRFDPAVGHARIAAPIVGCRDAAQRRSQDQRQRTDRHSLAGKFFLLCRHGDATGAYRRLLRRSWLTAWRAARRCWR